MSQLISPRRVAAKVKFSPPRGRRRAGWLRPRVVIALLSATAVVAAVAADRRAPPPKFEAGQFKGVFYDDVKQGLQGNRPAAGELRGAAGAGSNGAAGGGMANGSGAGGNTKAPGPAAVADAAGGWGAIIKPASLEDEIKRLKLRFDTTISTPAAFKSGGFEDARRDLSALAMLFQVIAQHPGQVRWKDSAPAARDLLARTAANCKAGSPQVFNEAKLRKQDLQDLINGSGLTAREAAEEVEWGAIVDRVPLMVYLGELVDERLKELSANDKSVESDGDEITRLSETVAVISDVMVGSGMADSTDSDYQGLALRMKTAALAARDSVTRKDAAGFNSAVGAMKQSCDACHEQYR